MTYLIKLFIFLCLFFLSPSASFAEEEPILIIDPQGHSAKITGIMFTPDGRTLISVSEDKTIRLWDTETGDIRGILRHQIGEGRDGVILAGALSPDGKTLAVGGISSKVGEEGTPVYLFNPASGNVIGVLTGHPDTVNSLDFSQDGKWLASGSGTEVRIWNVEDAPGAPDAPGTSPALMLTSSSIVFDLAFSPDAKMLVSGHVDGALRIWEIPGNLQKVEDFGVLTPQKIIKKHTNVVSSVAYSPDGKYIASVDFDGNKFLWDIKRGKVKKKFPLMETSGVAAFSPDSQKVMLNDGYDAEVFSVPGAKKLRTFTNHGSPLQNSAFSNSVSASAFYGNDLIATAGGNEYDIYIWDVNTGAVKTHIAGQGQRVEAVAFGEGLQVALGNTSGGLLKAGPLERSFNFSEMTLNHNLSSQDKFIRPQMKYQEKTLKYAFAEGKFYELKVEGAGTIKNGPKDGWVRAYSFTPAGNVVVGSSHVLRLHRSDGSVIREFFGHTGEVWDVSISRDGKILASASDDQTLKLWNIETGERLATLFIARDREWVCWTPKGYYAASAGGEKYIGWQINQGMENAAKYYPLSVFRNQLYHPELVKRTITYGNFEQALKEVGETPKPQLLRERSVILPPVVEWVKPKTLVVETTAPSIRILAKIRSDSTIKDNQITTFKLLVNGRTQATEQELRLSGRESGFYKEIVYDLPLMQGKNEISIFAATNYAGAPSDKLVVLYQAEGEEWLKPNLYVVSVGISEYPLNDLKLNYADDDARAMTRLFSAQAGKLYREVHVKYLYDDHATRENILDALEWLERLTTQSDIAVIFIAAHGLRSGKGNFYYILPVDGNPEKLRSTGVDWSDFAKTLGNLPSRVLMFLDTCHSGQLGQDVYGLFSRKDNTEALRELASDEFGVVILAASTGKETSKESAEWRHGAFTTALLEALEQGFADYPPKKDGIIHLRELDLYVDYRVRELTGDTQHPTTQKPSTISRFPIVQVK